MLAVPFLVLALAGRGGAAAVLLAWGGPAAAGAGIAVRARREARTRTAAGEALADTMLAHTARGERARIARELHDVVAHHISMVAVQAETARLTTPGLPAAGAHRFAEIGDTARAGLTEMRRLLGVLREDAEDAGATVADRHPLPGLPQLTELVDAARDASGAGIRLIVSGPVTEFDPGVELAAYRIVQEALTNARRHAPGAAVDVELCYADDALRLRVRDNGPGPEGSPETPGTEVTRRPAWRAAGTDCSGCGSGRSRWAAHCGPGPRRAAGSSSRRSCRRNRRSPGCGRPGPIVPSGGGPVSEEHRHRRVADDHEVVRAGFAALLDTQPDFTVLGTASDGAEAVLACQELKPDVVLMDVRMPGTDGIEATRQLVAGAGHVPRVLILTTFDLDEYVFDALRAGASGFLLKDATAERLFEAVRVVAAGEALLAPAVTRRLISEFTRIRPGTRAAGPASVAPAAFAALTPGRQKCSGWSPRACPTRR